MARPREAYVGKTTMGKDYYVGAGGSPEGVAMIGLKFATPSGPLCFFLRVEKEEPASTHICTRSNNMTQKQQATRPA